MTKQEQKDYLIYCIMHDLKSQDESSLTRYVKEKSKKQYRAYISNYDFCSYDSTYNPFFDNEFIKLYVDENITKHYGIESTITSEELKRAKQDSNFIIFPISIYDHSGVSLEVGEPMDPWDSWQCGCIILDTRDVNKSKALEVAKGIINRYNNFYNGTFLEVSIYEVSYCPICDDEKETLIASCTGFDDLETAKEYIENEVDNIKQVEIIEQY